MRNVLKQARQRQNMTQQQVAKYLGISIRYYQHIEVGTRNGDFEVWDALEDLFKIHQRELRVISYNRPGRVGRPAKHSGE